MGDRNREACQRMIGAATPMAVRLDDVQLLPPIVQPSKVICVGNSYKDYLSTRNSRRTNGLRTSRFRS